MLNIIFSNSNSKENFVLKDAVHESLVGFKPYIDSEVGIVDDGDPNSFILSIGDNNDSDANVVVGSPFLSITTNTLPLVTDKIVTMPFDLYIQRTLSNAKEHDAMYISGSGIVIDENKGKIYKVLHIFPDLLRDAKLEDIYNIFPDSNNMDDPFYPCGSYRENADVWIKDTKAEYSSADIKKYNMIALYSTGSTPITFSDFSDEKDHYLDKHLEFIKDINRQLIHFLIKLEAAKLI